MVTDSLVELNGPNTEEEEREEEEAELNRMSLR